MQTYAEKALIESLSRLLRKKNGFTLLNIGSGGSTVIEEALEKTGAKFIVDHLDVKPRKVKHSRIRKYIDSYAEDMGSVGDASYDACFSNFVWEHVNDAKAATNETFRILKPGATFFMTVPNPWAPEFILIRLIPFKLRGLIKQYEVWPTHYDYGSIGKLKRLCNTAGFAHVEVRMFPAFYTYVYRFPILSWIGKGYDALLRILHLNFLMGHALITCKKK